MGAPLATWTIWYTRPRGESISRPSSRYVGQAFRHRPQWMQRSRSTCCGPYALCSDTAIEPAAVEEVRGIEQPLQPFHQFKVGPGSGPQVERPLALFGRKLDHGFPAAPDGIHEPAHRGFGFFEVPITNPRTRPRQRRALEGGKHFFQPFQGTRGAHHHSIRVSRQERLSETLDCIP